MAVLLMLTIGYCMLLNTRLKRLKADEHSLKATIAELITATEIAERAIGGLKHTVRDVNENLGSQLAAATQMSQQLKKQLAEGDKWCGGCPRSRSRRGQRPRPSRRSCRVRDHEYRRPRRSRQPRRRSPTAEGRWPRRMKSFRDIRVIPVVLVAICGPRRAEDRRPRDRRRLRVRLSPRPTRPPNRPSLLGPGELQFPRRHRRPADITGSVDKPKEEKKDEASSPRPEAQAGRRAVPEETQPVSASERAILERLQSRRQELEARAREIDIRESLLKAAEKRIEFQDRGIEGRRIRITTATDQKNEAEAARFKGIITMYESMKPKDAAKVFDRLEMPVLIQIASQIAPRKMSDILGLMQTDAAERLTVELAHRAAPDQSAKRRTSQDRGQDVAAKAQLSRGYLTSP